MTGDVEIGPARRWVREGGAGAWRRHAARLDARGWLERPVGSWRHPVVRPPRGEGMDLRLALERDAAADVDRWVWARDLAEYHERRCAARLGPVSWWRRAGLWLTRHVVRVDWLVVRAALVAGTGRRARLERTLRVLLWVVEAHAKREE